MSLKKSNIALFDTQVVQFFLSIFKYRTINFSIVWKYSTVRFSIKVQKYIYVQIQYINLCNAMVT